MAALAALSAAVFANLPLYPVEQGRADFGIAIQVVARDRGLGFLPLTHERYDFVILKGRRARAAVEAFVALLAEPETRARLAAQGFAV